MVEQKWQLRINKRLQIKQTLFLSQLRGLSAISQGKEYKQASFVKPTFF